MGGVAYTSQMDSICYSVWVNSRPLVLEWAGLDKVEFIVKYIVNACVDQALLHTEAPQWDETWFLFSKAHKNMDIERAQAHRMDSTVDLLCR